MTKCIVKDCENHQHQGKFVGDVCGPCYEFIATGKGENSQAYRNISIKELQAKIDMLEKENEIFRSMYIASRHEGDFRTSTRKDLLDYIEYLRGCLG